MKRICLIDVKLASSEEKIDESIAFPLDKIYLHLYEQESFLLLSVFYNL